MYRLHAEWADQYRAAEVKEANCRGGDRREEGFMIASSQYPDHAS